MTLQKLYETLVCKTFDYASYVDEHPLNDIASKLTADFSNFNEIRVQLALLGSGIDLPKKADFKKFGEDYLIQSFLFITKNLKDNVFLEEFMETVVKYKSTSQLLTDKFKDVCYDIYLDNVMKEHDICITLSTFLASHCQTSDFYPKFCILANATGLISFDVKFGKYTHEEV